MFNTISVHCSQAARSPTAEDVAAGSTSPPAEMGDQPARPAPRRTREQAAAGSRRLRSGATIADPGRHSDICIAVFCRFWLLEESGCNCAKLCSHQPRDKHAVCPAPLTDQKHRQHMQGCNRLHAMLTRCRLALLYSCMLMMQHIHNTSVSTHVLICVHPLHCL